MGKYPLIGKTYGGQKMDQKSHWDDVFAQNSAFFGEAPSDFARRCCELFQKEGVRSVLELGCGQGRDTFLFAQQGFDITCVDYSETAISAVKEKAQKASLTAQIHAQTHNLKEAMLFSDNSFDACFSHMLLCMHLSTAEIGFVLREMHRVLKPGGIAVYSVRNNFDKHYRAGTHLSEDIYDVGGFVIHFLTEEKIKKLAKGYDIVEINRLEEGSLPRDLFVVTLRKAASPENWELEDTKESKDMNDPMQKFQEFLDATLAPRVLENKTKQLVTLAAALAAGCDP
ncbi:class I SAM-dependent methyltransferase [Desulfopila sp. IMCC35006]|nr:class I SAM-dependent methyltransferase [Desulfopila sp. IMCC35006]